MIFSDFFFFFLAIRLTPFSVFLFVLSVCPAITFPFLLPLYTNNITLATGLVKLNEAHLPVRQANLEVKYLSEETYLVHISTPALRAVANCELLQKNTHTH